MSSPLATYLEQTSQLYDKIDPEIIITVWEHIKQHFTLPKIIHIIGTNGKGSTGRFLALFLKQAGFLTGHYTSPHITHFNERIWLDGKSIDDEALERAHQSLQVILKDIPQQLSYFEYTTLLGMYALQNCDYVVVEAGLGGEFDATNIFPKVLSLITPIGYDHQDFLGETLDEIATTKIRSVNNPAIIGVQFFDEVIEIAQNVLNETYPLYRISDLLTTQEIKEIKKHIDAAEYASYFVENVSLAYSAIKQLDIVLPLSSYPFTAFNLSARFERIAPNIIIDSGHNPLAAQKIVTEFKTRKITLIYNSFADKDYHQVLRILKPIIETLEILPVSHPRSADISNIADVAKELHIPHLIHTQIDAKKEYLVFGSFSVVEAFLKQNR